MNYVFILLAVVALCAGWAVFQVWLSRHDPDANQRLRKCGDCNCDRSDTIEAEQERQ